MAVRESGMKALFRRFTASAEELDAEDLQRASEESGATSVCDCSKGRTVTVTGRLRSVVYTPKTNLPTLEAELFDGSGTVTLVWLGRRRILGIEPGRCVRATGRLAVDGDRKLIYNPFYELEATSG
ncbi:MAG TPA: OB-fold nucleic acid binding domain-containing protein [Mycobacteriales bacterium]|jgi:hypothetical protein